jgi:hypothetical protein
VEWSDPLLLDKKEMVEKICESISLKSINKKNQKITGVKEDIRSIENINVLAWIEIFKKIIESGLSTSEVIERLGLYKYKN